MPIAMMPVVGAIIRATTPAADITTFTGFATSLLQWLITTFGTIISFLLENPICLVGLVMSLVVAAIGTLRHLIGG